MAAEIVMIFGSVDYQNWDFLKKYRGKVRVVCADGGLQLAKKAGFRPELLVGDNDSGGSADAKLPTVLLPTQKDVTDLQAAYRYCLEQGCREFIFTACTGGRQDHHLANLQLLEQAAKDGVRARIVDPDNEIRYFPGGTTNFSCCGFRYFSLLPIDEQLEGVSIRHAKYPLDQVRVHRGDSLTVSNEPLDGPVTVTVERGACWLIFSQRI